MGFAEILGQQSVVGLLQKALSRERLPHAFLFTGMQGVGKLLVALTLSKAVNCEQTVAGDCCDHCLSCRKATSGNHPDISLIESDGSFIKIEQIRSLKRSLRFRPLEGRCRVTVIQNAPNMKAEAANALLKVLEEPPPDNLLILTATESAALIPTIVSRCLHLRFQPLAASDLTAHLTQTHSLPPERARLIAGLAGGSLSRAEELVDEGKIARRHKVLEAVANLHQFKAADLIATAEAWRGGNTDFVQDLEWLKTWTRDLLIYNLKVVAGGDLINSDFDNKIATAAPQFCNQHLIEVFEFLCTAQEAISYNINKRLCLETLLLRLHSLVTTNEDSASYSLPGLGKGIFARTFYE
ncbi:MAG: DNA polymerase III subunit delta' [Deltaproteobacteria bacterium]|nr:MAG: DNA polymerase III subunit delta' [Deltaproteobacteria bacterium]